MTSAPSQVVETPIYTVAKCLKELIVNKDLDEALEKIVEWLSASLDIDRCYIFEHSFDTHSQTFLKSFRHGREEGIRGESIKDTDSIFNLQSFPELKSVIDRKKSLKVSINNNLSAQLRTVLERTELKSLLILPVCTESGTWGFIGFGDTQNIRTWRNSEQELQSLASAIGVALESKRINDNISLSNEVYSSALSNLNEVVWELDLQNNFIKSIGSSRHIGPERSGETKINFNNWLNEFVHPEDRQRVLDKYNNFLLKDDGAHEEDVYRVFNTDTNSYGWIMARRKLKKNAAGIAIGVTGITRDLTSPEDVTNELEQHREQYNFLVQSVGQVVFTLDTSGQWLSLSNAWHDLSGFNTYKTLGTSCLEYFRNENLTTALNELLNGVVQSIDKQVQFQRKNGDEIWVRFLAKSTTDHDGKVNGIFGTIENINNKYTTDLLVKESNEKLNTILNSSKEIILTINLDKGIIENVNEAVEILGYHPFEWIGKDYRTWDTEKRKKFHELMKLAVKSELQVSNQHISFANKDNTEEIPFEFSTSIFSFKHEKFLLCILRDIRERVEYEKNISNISTQLTHLISNIDDVYAIFDLKTNTYDFISDNIEQLYAIKKEKFIENVSLWKEVIHIEDVAGVEREMNVVLSHKFRSEFFYRIITPGGETKMLLEKSSISRDADGNPDKLFTVKTDYTNIENAEKSLIETERKFRFISENISDFISIHDTDGNFTYASPSIKNILGYEPDQMLKGGVLDFVHPEDVERTLDELMRPIVIEKRETQLRYRMLSITGEYKWVETYAKPVIDFKGEISSIIASSRDVTDQVYADEMLKKSMNERDQLLLELEQALAKERELNELRSMFVSTASHQFRTPLTVIQSGVEIMEMYLEDLPAEKQQRFQRQFNKIQGEVERLQYLMSDILVLGRANAARTPFEPKTDDLVEFAKQIIEEKYNHNHQQDRQILFSVSGLIQPVDFDAKLLGHAFENIISNGYKYSEKGNLAFDITFFDEEVQIAITDPGIGIPDEDLKNLFQPFYRATNTNDIEGTGLGLAIMKEFVDKHSGKINVTSILNKGTTVNVILPIKQKI